MIDIILREEYIMKVDLLDKPTGTFIFRLRGDFQTCAFNTGT